MATINGMTYRIKGTISFADETTALVDVAYDGDRVLQLRPATTSYYGIFQLENGDSFTTMGLSGTRITVFAPSLGIDIGPASGYPSSMLYAAKQINDYNFQVSGILSFDDNTEKHWNTEVNKQMSSTYATTDLEGNSSANHDDILANLSYLTILESIWGAAFGVDVTITASV